MTSVCFQLAASVLSLALRAICAIRLWAITNGIHCHCTCIHHNENEVSLATSGLELAVSKIFLMGH